MLEDLWETLSRCLVQLANTSDHHAVLVLQPAVEAFFLIHSGESFCPIWIKRRNSKIVIVINEAKRVLCAFYLALCSRLLTVAAK